VSSPGELGTGLIVSSALFVVCFAALSSVVGAFTTRRSHFWLRALLLPVLPAVLPAALTFSVKLGIVRGATMRAVGPALAVVCALVLFALPFALFRGSGAPPADSEGGDDIGPGPPPELPPNPPSGGIPLPDAEQGRRRLRDHSAQPAARRRTVTHVRKGRQRSTSARNAVSSSTSSGRP
jgi:hypothetical protein